MKILRFLKDRINYKANENEMAIFGRNLNFYLAPYYQTEHEFPPRSH